MARSRKPAKRSWPPDSKYGSPLITRFVNSVVSRGKRSTAERIFYDAMDIVAEKTGEDPLAVFNRAINNVKPSLEVKSRRVGGATYQVPVEVPQQRRAALAIRWLKAAALARSEHGMENKLAGEILDAAKGAGTAYKKKEDTHRMAEANKAFAHYRW
ncbi:MAG TPA: 30S ribosomal protein S7 [bacterium]|nr:30S ribosomal protein S7 [bacterium]